MHRRREEIRRSFKGQPFSIYVEFDQYDSFGEIIKDMDHGDILQLVNARLRERGIARAQEAARRRMNKEKKG